MNLRDLAVLSCVCLSPLLAQDRMPPIPADQMTPAQKKSIELLTATPRGANGAGGPFVPLLRSPELMDRLQAVGEHLRFHNALPQKLVEMTILITARHWTQQYEWNAHYPLALKAGLQPEIAAAIAAGRRPESMAEDEETAYNFVSELLQNHSVSDATYARVEKKFGEEGVIDASGIVGYYTTLGMIMNVARTPPQPGSTAPKLVPFP